jgi:hypothetical protein
VTLNEIRLASAASSIDRLPLKWRIVIWQEDTHLSDPPFESKALEPPSREVLDTILENVATFKPLGPWSTHSLLSVAIIKGVANNDLFVGETPFIRYFDPVGRRGVAAGAMWKTSQPQPVIKSEGEC